jgi:tetratricopeptide (TPR) repeat protein/predicted Ser/Thr protein kinase
MPGSAKPLPGSDDPTLVPENSGTIAQTLTPVPPSSDAATSAGVPVAPQSSGAASVLQIGFILGGRYEILESLGEGGMGAVYKARDRELDRLVALKVIRPDLASNPAIIQRFKQELILARQITQRNVVRIFDLGEAAGIKFITMEYVEGQDLHSLLQEHKKFAPKEAVEIILQTCRALEAAHGEGIIHRDLKPQNIMRHKQGRIVVMDFGLARSLEAAGMTQTGALVGTMDYMSPEQALGKDLDQRSDLFAVGLIFYELLTGKMPYKSESVVASLLKRTQQRAVPVLTHDPTIPTVISNVVSKCLEPDINLRYQTSSEILADLEAWQGGRAAATLHFPTGARPWGQTLPWHWIGGVAAVLVLAIVGFLFRDKLFRPATRAPSGPVVSLAILPFRNASGDPALDWLGPSLADMLSTDVGQSARLRTISPDRMHQVLSDLRIAPGASFDPTMLRHIAESSNADTLVWGQYAKLGDQIRIDATVQDLKHDRSASIKSEGSTEKDLSSAVDRLADTIRQNLALAPDIIKELRAQSFKPSSSSLEALRDYNQGVQLLRDGKNLDAVKRFEAAIKEDQQFALAYSKLGQTYSNLGRDSEAEQYSSQAVALSEKLPPPEKYRIAASHARIKKDYPKAIESYENLAKVAPGDPDLQFTLAYLYEETGSFDRAGELYTKVLTSDPKHLDALLAMGRVEVYKDNLQSGLDYLNRALSLAVQLDNQEEKAAILQPIGVVYALMSKPDEALRNYQQSLDIKRRLGQKKGIAQSLRAMAQLQDGMGNWQLASKNYNEALQLEREIGDTKGLGDTLMDLGNSYNDHGQYDQALKLLKEALQIQRNVGNENFVGLCLNSIGNTYFSRGDFDDARTYFEQALTVREKLKVPSDIADTLHNLAETSLNVGEYDAALAQYLRALEINRNSGDKRRAAIESYSIGTLFENQGRYGAGVSSKEEALKSFRGLQDRSFWMGEILSGYGHVLEGAGRHEEAQKILDEALNLARELKNDALISQTLNFQGDGFFYRGDLKSAQSSYAQALQAASRSADRAKVLLSKINLAKTAVRQGRSREAITTLKGLAQEADTLGLKYNSAECSIYLADALVETKDYAQARQEVERALVKAEKSGLRTFQVKGQYLLATALRLSGNPADAVGHYREAIRLLEEIRNEPKAEKVLQRADLNAIYVDSSRWSQSPKT